MCRCAHPDKCEECTGRRVSYNTGFDAAGWEAQGCPLLQPGRLALAKSMAGPMLHFESLKH
jgi:hypothetical protein